MERSVLQGLAVFRWAAWAWMVIVLVITRDEVTRPAIAVAAVGAALAVTAAATAHNHADRTGTLRRAAVATELVVGGALLAIDGVVAVRGAAFDTRQSLGSVWPLAGVLAAGVAWGPVGGGSAGVVVGLGRVVAVTVNGAGLDESGRLLSLATTIVFYGLAGAVAGHLFRLIQRAERDVSSARAREEVARTLHDGVLQTLALVERRSGDPDLARLAREQERDLREFLFGGRADGTGTDVAGGLRHMAGRFETAYGGRVDVVVAPDIVAPDARRTAALIGAVGEALTNAGKHGGATVVTVYLEPAEGDRAGVVCSVRDDGSGFEVAETPEGVGLGRSVRGRIEDVGGRVEVRSRPGEGTEITMWVP